MMLFSVFARIRALALAERERWPLWTPVLLGGGIGVYFALGVEPPLWSGWAGTAFFALLARIAWTRNKDGAALFALSCAIFALGVGVASFKTYWVAHPIIDGQTGAIRVKGQVTRLEIRPKGARVTLKNLTISDLAPERTPQAVRLTLRGRQPVLSPGDWIRALANIKAPPPPAAPGAFDFQRQSYFRGLGGVGFVYGPVTRIDGPPTPTVERFVYAFQRLRFRIAARIQTALPGETGAVAAALTTGERGAIPRDVMIAMRASGLAHLLAISGLHVGLVAGILFFTVRAALALVGPLALRFPIKKWAAMAAMGGVLFYALLAGATVPTQRAFLMVSLVLSAIVFERHALSMRTLAWAAMAVLIISPQSLLGASFQLSFAAVTALIAVFETLRDHGFFRHNHGGVFKRIGRYAVGVALTTLVAGAATAAFAAFHFNRVADYALAANLIAIPIMALWIMPWAVAAYALMPFGMERWALEPMGWGIEVVLSTARTVAAWPGAQTMAPAYPLWGLVLVSVGGLWLALWQGRWRMWGAPVIVLGIGAILLARSPDVLIDASGKLAAVKTADGGYRISTLTTKRFERHLWLRRAGLRAAVGRWPRDSETTNGEGNSVRCDTQGCVYRENDKVRVAFSHTPDAIAEDCAKAPVVVDLSGTAQRKRCAAKMLITLKDLRTQGTHALYFETGGVRVRTVRALRGMRPWVVPTVLPFKTSKP